MLNFSKINIISIYLIFFVIAIFSILNFQKGEKFPIDKKVNLGLDLQGGSYLLLEINSDTLIEEKIQSKVIPLKKKLIENKIKFKNFKILDNEISFNISNDEIKNDVDYSTTINVINMKRIINEISSFGAKVIFFSSDMINPLSYKTLRILLPNTKSMVKKIKIVIVRL